MQFEPYYQLLARPDVKELALQTSRPPCVLMGAGYKPVANRPATEDEIIALLAETGAADMLGLMEGHRKWTFEHPIVGTIHVSAGYHGQMLQARLKRDPGAAARQTQRSLQEQAGGGFNASASMAELTFGSPANDGAQPLGGDEFGAPARAKKPIRAGEAPGVRSREEPARKAVPDDLFGPVEDPPAPPTQRRVTAHEAAPAPAAPRRVTAHEAAPAAPPRRTTAHEAAPAFAPPRAEPSPKPAPFAAPRAQPRQAEAKPAWQPPPADPFAQDGQDDEVDDFPVPDDSAPAPQVARAASPAPVAGEALDYFLRAAREQGASDLHILADRAPTLRIAGDLVAMGEALSADYVEQMLLPAVPDRVRADLVEHGACDFALASANYGRFRANITRQRTGYKLTARPIGTNVPTLEELGLPLAIAGASHHHQGLIVITGPTGHGKTTTLAALVNLINSEKAHHIITVEDPIEYVHPRKMSVMSQREVGTHTKKFASALKGSLREDPDVIVVGELRDTETVRMALSASETGHLVISTMNTPSAAKAIERLIDLFPPGDQPQVRLTLAGGLRLVISQRLVPNADRTGMVVACELLPGSPPLWALIRDGKTFQIPSLQQRGKALGIVRLDDSLAELVRSGKSDLETCRSYAENPGDFEAVVAGKNNRGGEELTIDSFDPTQAAAAAAKEKAKEVFSRAGKFFGNENKK